MEGVCSETVGKIRVIPPDLKNPIVLDTFSRFVPDSRTPLSVGQPPKQWVASPTGAMAEQHVSGRFMYLSSRVFLVDKVYS